MLVVFLGGIFSLAFAEASKPDSVITAFDGKISVQFLARYNFASLVLNDSEKETFETNRPIDLGLGGGYGDWTWSTLFTFRFGADGKKPKTRATDLQLNYFGDRIFWRAFFKVNKGFAWKDSDADKYRKVDLRTISAGIDLDVLGNSEHSIRAAYALDRRQWKSNGSFLWGLGVYYNGIGAKDSLLPDYEKFQSVLHSGPSFGYSHTWVWRNGIFLNILGVVSGSVGRNFTKSEWCALTQVFPKFAAGYHGESWSIHFPFEVNLVQLDALRQSSDIFFGASGGFMVTRRF